MHHLPLGATDEQLIQLVDQWAALMEKEDYEGAYGFTSHIAWMKWTPALIRQVIKSYGRCTESQRVTVAGKPTDISQRKDVSRWRKSGNGEIAEIWYDLSIDGYASDLTATFRVIENSDGLEVCLNDIHVM
jgi:hypothetical protein